MSRVISAILGQPEHIVAKTLKQLEDKNGNPSHDVRHLADNIQKTRTKIAQLGLDPNDTTAQELYHALLVKFQHDSEQFNSLNGQSSNDFESKSTKAVYIVSQSLDLPQRWVLKSNAAKKLLRQNPPKRTMKQLNYRSIESLLKRENLNEVQLAASFIETSAWQKAQARLIAKLDSSSFELRGVNLGYLSANKWGDLTSGQVIYDDNVGQLALVETDHSPNTPLLSLVILLIDALAEFKDINLSKEIAKLSPVLAWWSDMDGLISELNSEHVSLNIKDNALNTSHAQPYEERVMDGSRNSFWKELTKRYDNQLAAEEDNLLNLKDQLINFKPLSDHQPAFEYVENF